MMPNKWDVWLVNMPYEEGIGSKVRPALVIDPQHNFVIVGKMTSHVPRNNYPHEYAVQDWQGAGLTRPTTLRLSQRPQLEVASFIKKLGVMQPIDLVNIYSILNDITNEENH